MCICFKKDDQVLTKVAQHYNAAVRAQHDDDGDEHSKALLAVEIYITIDYKWESHSSHAIKVGIEIISLEILNCKASLVS